MFRVTVTFLLLPSMLGFASSRALYRQQPSFMSADEAPTRTAESMKEITDTSGLKFIDVRDAATAKSAPLNNIQLERKMSMSQRLIAVPLAELEARAEGVLGRGDAAKECKILCCGSDEETASAEAILLAAGYRNTVTGGVSYDIMQEILKPAE